jgi:hypothetical protein
MCMLLPNSLGSWKYPFYMHGVAYSLGSWNYLLLAWHMVYTGLWVLGKDYMLLLILRALIGKRAPPLWLRCCSLKSLLFWSSWNTDFCVIFLDMNGVALYWSPLCIFSVALLLFYLVIGQSLYNVIDTYALQLLARNRASSCQYYCY